MQIELSSHDCCDLQGFKTKSIEPGGTQAIDLCGFRKALENIEKMDAFFLCGVLYVCVSFVFYYVWQIFADLRRSSQIFADLLH